MGTWADNGVTHNPIYAEYSLSAQHNTIDLMHLRVVMQSDYASSEFDVDDVTEFLEDIRAALIAAGKFNDIRIGRTNRELSGDTYTP